MSEWTLETLKEYLESLVANERALRLARREDDHLALDKAERSLNKRLDSMNEIREQLRMQSETFLPRETYEAGMTQWLEWRQSVDRYIIAGTGRSEGVTATGKLIAGLIAAATGVITIAVVLANILTTH